MSIGNSIWSYFIGPLTDIWDSIKSLPDLIVNGIQDILTFLFIPEDDYFAIRFEYLKDIFVSKIGVDGSELDNLKNVTTTNIGNLDIFNVNLMGHNVKIVDLSIFNNFISKFHNIARGFMYPLLLLFNLNQLYFLIRGEKLFGGVKE